MFNRHINDYDYRSLSKFLHSVPPFFLAVLWALEGVSKPLEGRHDILYSSILHISWAANGTITVITSILQMLNIFEALLQSLCKIKSTSSLGASSESHGLSSYPGEYLLHESFFFCLGLFYEFSTCLVIWGDGVRGKIMSQSLSPLTSSQIHDCCSPVSPPVHPTYLLLWIELSFPQTLVILLMAHSAHITHLAHPHKLLLPNIHAYNLSSTLPMLVYHSYFSEKEISWTLLLVIKSNDNSNVFLLPSTHSDSSHIFWSMLLDMEVSSLFVDIRIQTQRLLVALPRFHKNMMLPMRIKPSISDL